MRRREEGERAGRRDTEMRVGRAREDRRDRQRRLGAGDRGEEELEKE